MRKIILIAIISNLAYGKKVMQQSQVSNVPININMDGVTITIGAKELLDEVKKRMIEESKSTFDTFKSNIKKIIFCSTAAYYGYLYYKINGINKLITGDNNWSSWKANLTLEQIYSMDKASLRDDLMRDIQARNSLVFDTEKYFIDEVSAEAKQLEYYLNVHKWCSKLRIAFLLPFDQNNLDLAKEKLHRLAFMKSLLKPNILRYFVELM